MTTDPLTEFRNNDGGSITAAAFFAAAPGREVKVRGTLIGNVVLAERAELAGLTGIRGDGGRDSRPNRSVPGFN